MVTASLEELGINRAQIIRAIETLKANLEDVNPTNLALELGVPRSYIYSDIAFLELIFKNSNSLKGEDEFVHKLIKDLKSNQRKVLKLSKQLDSQSKQIESSFNDGFSQGAALNYKPQKENLEFWARGILYIDQDLELNCELVKKSYRQMVSLLHPDKTYSNSNEIFPQVKQAYDLLMSIYEK